MIKIPVPDNIADQIRIATVLGKAEELINSAKKVLTYLMNC